MGQEPSDPQPTTPVVPAAPPATPPAAPAAPPVPAPPVAPSEPDAPKPDQDTFPREYVEQLRREAAGYRTRLQEIDDASKSELEKAQERSGTLETEVSTLVRENVALKAGLPADFAKRLSGSTREELEADAVELAKQFKTDARPPDWDGGPRGGAAPPALSDDASPLQRLSHAYSEPT